jgi:hypothetical protein
MKKVAIIDNTCNNGYVLMRYLNDLGIDTHLLLLGPLDGHADPENDTFDRQYFDKIIKTGWANKSLLRLRNKEINSILDNYDFIIGGDYSPALFYRIKRKLDIFQPHGTDLFTYPFAKLNGISKRTVGEWILGFWQRKGIKNYTKYLLFELTNDENEKYVNYFKNPGFKRIYKTPPFVYDTQYHPTSVSNFSETNQKVKLLRTYKEQGYTILFHHCQQQWANPVHYLFNKGNNKIIEGIKLFTKQSPSGKLKVVFIERGTDVETSKALINKLGLNDYFIWFPVMPRKEIMACLAYADLGIGEIEHSWFTYSVVTEFMAMGIPIMHNCDLNYYKKVHQTIYPMYPVDSAESISETIKQYFHDPGPFKDSGGKAHDWWKKNLVMDTLGEIIKLINEKRLAN